MASLLPAAQLVLGQLSQGAVAVGAAWWIAGPRASGVVPPRALHVVAAVLVGASCWYLDLRAGELMPWVDAQGADAHSLTEIVRGPSLAVSLLTLAVLPAVCEELVFRGVLARGLATRLPPVAAAAIAAVLFAGYHMSPLQLVPAFLLGLALGALALRARSVVPAIVAHALNNAIVIWMTRDDGAAGWLDDHGTAALAGAIVLTGAGLAMLAAVRPA